MLETHEQSWETSEDIEKALTHRKKVRAISTAALFGIVCVLVLVFVCKNNESTNLDDVVVEQSSATSTDDEKIMAQLAELAQNATTTVDQEALTEQVHTLSATDQTEMSTSTQASLLQQLGSLNQ